MDFALKSVFQYILGRLAIFESPPKVSQKEGVVVLEDVKLRLPAGLSGTIKTLRMEIPWRAFRSTSLSIVADGVSIIVYSNLKDSPTRDNDNSDDTVVPAINEKGYFLKQWENIVNSASLVITNFEFQYQCKGNGGGITTERSSALVVTAERIQWENCNENWEQAFISTEAGVSEWRKKATVTNLCISTNDDDDARNEPHPPIITNWDMTCQITLSYESSSAPSPSVSASLCLKSCDDDNNLPLKVAVSDSSVLVIGTILNELFFQEHFIPQMLLSSHNTEDISPRKSSRFTDSITSYLVPHLNEGGVFTSSCSESIEDDDDDDLFQDALSPPTYSISCNLVNGVVVEICRRAVRHTIITTTDDKGMLLWILQVGAIDLRYTATVVEHTVNMTVASVRFEDHSDVDVIIPLLCNSSSAEEKEQPCFNIKAIVPNYESRKVGKQPAFDIKIAHRIQLVLDPLVYYQISKVFTPLSKFWWAGKEQHQWQGVVKKKLISDDEEAVAPLSVINFDMVELVLVFAINSYLPSRNLRVTIKEGRVRSTEDRGGWVVLSMAVGQISVVSGENPIVQVENICGSVKSRTQAEWLGKAGHRCFHYVSEASSLLLKSPSSQLKKSQDEKAMYYIDIIVPPISCKLVSAETLNDIMWIIGSWNSTKSSPVAIVPSENKNPRRCKVDFTLQCSKVSVAVDYLNVVLLCDGISVQSTVCSRVIEARLGVKLLAAYQLFPARVPLIVIKTSTIEYWQCDDSPSVVCVNTGNDVTIDWYPVVLRSVFESISYGVQQMLFAMELYSMEDTSLVRDSEEVSQFQLFIQTKGLILNLRHNDEVLSVAAVQRTNLVFHIQSSTSSSCPSFDARGCVEGVSLVDQSIKDENNPNKKVLSSSSGDDDDGGVVDFSINASKNGYPRIAIRCDSVRVVYCQRFYYEMESYFKSFVLPTCCAWTRDFFTEIRTNVQTCYHINASEEFMTRASSERRQEPSRLLQLDVIANDFTFSIPQHSLSKNAVSFTASTIKFWSVYQRKLTSHVMKTGLFEDESFRPPSPRARVRSRGSSVDFETSSYRRRQLRKLRHDLRHQRSILRHNISIVDKDYRNSKLQHENFVHTNREESDDALEAVRVLKKKLGALTTDFKAFSKAIDDVELQINGGVEMTSNDSIVKLLQKHSTEVVLSAPIFAAEDSDFYDALHQKEEEEEEDLESFGFILSDVFIDIVQDGTVTSSLVKHTSATVKLHFPLTVEPRTPAYERHYSEKQYQLSPILTVSVMLSELHVTTDNEDDAYKQIICMIKQNFKEEPVVMESLIPDACDKCGGRHFEEEHCGEVWLCVPISSPDASLLLDGELQTKFSFENLKVMFCLKTDESLGLYVSTDALAVVKDHKTSLIQRLVGTESDSEPQIIYYQHESLNEVSYNLLLRDSCVQCIVADFVQIANFFSSPFENPSEFKTAYNPSDDFEIDTTILELECKQCVYCLLETTTDDDDPQSSRILKILSDFTYRQSWIGFLKSDGQMELSLSAQQHGIAFDTLPLTISDTPSSSLCNPFIVQIDSLYCWNDTGAQRRVTVALHPVELRFSMREYVLFDAIISSLTENVASLPKTAQLEISSTEEKMESHSKSSFMIGAQLGDVRVVIVNHSLGIPIVDLKVEKSSVLYRGDSTKVCAKDSSFNFELDFTLSMNYFNNGIYRWEPLIEPFVIRGEVLKQSTESSATRADIFVTDVNVNLTEAMASLLSAEMLNVNETLMMMAPFWIQNDTGMDIAISFRRGAGGDLIEKKIACGKREPLDCRSNDAIQTFDTISEDIFESSDNYSNGLIENHTLSVKDSDTCGEIWSTLTPVVVDIVGYHAIPLKKGKNSEAFLVMHVSLQEDGSKLVSVHSSILFENNLTMPLSLWLFSPKDHGGIVHECLVPALSRYYIPVHLIQSQCKLSIRPATECEWSALDEFSSDSFLAAEFASVENGVCACPFAKAGDGVEKSEEENKLRNLAPGLPSWQCMYSISSKVLDRASVIQKQVLVRLDEEDDESDEKASFGFENPMKIGEKFDGFRKHLEDMKDELDRAASFSDLSFSKEEDDLKYTPVMRTVSFDPSLKLHNRLASPVAYRLMKQSLELLAEGILPVGGVLPAYQVDLESCLFVSFRLQNYNWSVPSLILNPKDSARCLPFKNKVDSICLEGRSFETKSDYNASQGQVPNLYLQLRLNDRDVILFSRLWLRNHSGMTLEYCESVKKQDFNYVKRYTHLPPHGSDTSSASPVRSPRTLLQGSRRRCDYKVKPDVEPVALIVIVNQAKDLHRPNYFIQQHPFVRAMVVSKAEARGATGLLKDCFCVDSTKSSAPESGTKTPEWTHKEHSTLYLAFPPDIPNSPRLKVVIQVRSKWAGRESKLGWVEIPLSGILHDPTTAAKNQWYPLKRINRQSVEVDAGQLSLSFMIGSAQILSSEIVEENFEHVREKEKSTNGSDYSASSSPDDTAIVESNYSLQVYLPTNRFESVRISVHKHMKVSEVFFKVMSELFLANEEEHDVANYEFFILRLPRFDANHSAGRPEYEKWWSTEVLRMTDRLGESSRYEFGLHLCNKLARTTIRSYDEGKATASIYHQTPKAVEYGGKSTSKPCEWPNTLMVCPRVKSKYDTLCIRTVDSEWSIPLQLQKNAMANSVDAQGIILNHESGKKQSSLLHQQYELSLWASYGSGYFSDTVVATFVPRFVLLNQTQEVIMYRQNAANAPIISLEVGSVYAHHWFSATEEKRIVLSFGSSDWTTSGSVALTTIGTTYVKLRRRENYAELYILQCQVDLVGGTYVVCFREETPRWPPYRIDNLTSFRIQYKQYRWEGNSEYCWDELEPGQSCSYAWDDLSSGNKELSVKFMQVSTASGTNARDAAETREYSLDDMVTHKSMRLQRSLPSFAKCELQGYLLKRDNQSLRRKWHRRYFRLKNSVLYYFSSPEDMELRGVVDLCPGAAGGGLVSIYQQERVPSTSGGAQGVLSLLLKPLSISSSSSNKKKEVLDTETLLLTAARLLRVAKQEDNGEFVIRGRDVVNYILANRICDTEEEARAAGMQLLSQSMLEPTDASSHTTFVEEDTYSLPPLISADKVSDDKSNSSFFIVTAAKCYEMKADTKREMDLWISALRSASRTTGNVNELAVPELPGNTKTFVESRIRADGPTKVLELREVGMDETIQQQNNSSRKDSIGIGTGSASETGSQYSSPGNSPKALVPSEAIESWTHQMSLSVQSVGISVINSRPEEVVFMKLGGLNGLLLYSASQACTSVMLDEIQADNQTSHSTFTTLLCKKEDEDKEGGRETDEVNRMGFQCDTCGASRSSGNLASHFCTKWSQPDVTRTTNYFEYLTLWVCPLMVQLDEELLVFLKSFSRKLLLLVTISDRKNFQKSSASGEKQHLRHDVLTDYKEALSIEGLDPLGCVETSMAEIQNASRVNIKTYFALLHIHPIELVVTFRSDSLVNDSNSSSSLRIIIPDLDKASIKFMRLSIEHAFGSKTDLVSSVGASYTRQLWGQLLAIVGSFDFLGNPIGLLDHVGTGVKDLFTETSRGIQRGKVADGLRKGTTSLVSNTLDGGFDFVSKITGTAGQSFATFSFDDHYKYNRARARRKNVRNLHEGVVQGAKEFGLGFYEGVSGLVLAPYRGARDAGAIGLAKGTVSGILGVPLKPVAGVFDFASRASQGVRNQSRSRRGGENSGELVGRVRAPRVFGRHRQLRVYREEDVVAHYIVSTVSDINLDCGTASEHILYQFELMEEETQTVSNKVLISTKKDLECIISVLEEKDLIVNQYVTINNVNILPGDKLVAIGSNDFCVSKTDLEDLLADFTSVSLNFASELQSSSQNNVVAHWVIITDKRVLYVNTSDFDAMFIEWTSPLCHIHSVKQQQLTDEIIQLQLNVGINSLPIGPVTNKKKLCTVNNTDMEVWSTVMSKAFGNTKLPTNNVLVATVQELYPSSSFIQGYLKKSGQFSDSSRFFVLSRNCLYHFLKADKVTLRGVTPLSPFLEIILCDNSRQIIIRPEILSSHEGGGALISTITVDNPSTLKISEKLVPELRLTAPTEADGEKWYAGMLHAAGKGMRNRVGTRYYVPPSELTPLEIRCSSSTTASSSSLVCAAVQNAIEKKRNL